MAAKKGSKRTNGAKKNNAKQKQSMAKRQVTAILLFTLAVLILFILLIPGQNVWTFLHKMFFGLFGIPAFALPVLLGYVAIMLAINKSDRSMITTTLVSGGLLLFVCAAVDIFIHSVDNLSFFEYIGKAYTESSNISGGGFFGAVVGYPMTYLFSSVGAKIITVLLVFVFLMLITKTTLSSLYDKASKPVKEIRERREIRREERENAPETEYPQHPVTSKNTDIEAYDDIPLINTKKKKGLFGRKNKQNSNGAKFNIDVPIGDTPVKNDGIGLDIEVNQKRDKLIDEYSNEKIIKKENNDVNINTEEIINNVNKAQEAGGADNNAANAVPNNTPTADNKPESAKAENADKKPKKRSVMADSVDDLPATGVTVEVDADYKFPPLSLLSDSKAVDETSISKELQSKSETLVNTLKSFGVETRLVGISHGPSVTRYELQPAAGVKISKITGLANDIALNLASSGVRIEAPIPNKAAVGIEVPNKLRSSVGIKELLQSASFRNAKSKLTCVLGKDITGEIITMDLAKMPHLLVAGTTGSGKSVCLNSMIASILYKARPDEVKLIMIDPKQVEFMNYNGIPHLLVPVVTNPQKAAGALSWAVNEMLKRYQRFSSNGVRNIQGYNDLCKTDESMEPMPQIVIFIDELSDLMMAAPNEVEDSICRLAQMARAAGMHMVIATQSPRVDVITGLIKANIPSRIALTVSNAMDSRVILDMAGAENLVGYGDMLYFPTGMNKPLRVQGCYMPDEDIHSVVEFLKKSGLDTQYDDEIVSEMDKQAELAANKNNGSSSDSDGESVGDEKLSEAVEIVCKEGQASTSFLQRKLKLGYARAARIMDEMEEKGVIGPFEGSKPRKVLITYNQWLERVNGGNAQMTLDDEPDGDVSDSDMPSDDEIREMNDEMVDEPPFDEI